MKIKGKLLYKDLTKFKIEKVVICSLDQSLYQALLIDNDDEHLIWESNSKPLKTRSLMKMQELFEELEVGELVLRQESAYDEMVGLNVKGSNRMEVRLSKKPYQTRAKT